MSLMTTGRLRLFAMALTGALLTGGGWLAFQRHTDGGDTDETSVLLNHRPRSMPESDEPLPAPLDQQIEALQQEAERAPLRAAKKALALGEDSLVAVISVWGNSDPNAAIAWVQELEVPQRDPLFAVLAIELATERTSVALLLADSIDAPELRGDSLGFVLAQMADTQPERVFEWLAQADDDTASGRRAERQALSALAVSDPVRVASWIADGHVHPASVGATVAAVVQNWSRKDASGVAAWIAEFPDARLKRDALMLLMRNWVADTPDAANEWVLHCEDEATQIAATEAIAAASATLNGSR